MLLTLPASLAALTVSRLQEALEEATPGDLQAALGLCEQLGDLFSKHGDYRRAVEFYERQVSQGLLGQGAGQACP